jgi:Na+/melibiose symporter-like transporter
VFFVSVPIALVAVVLVTLLCPSSKEAHSRPLDPLGSLLSVAGFGALLYGIIEGPEKGWGSVHSIGAFAVAVVALVCFVLWERRSAHPMLDVRFFSIPRFGAGALGVTITFLAMFSMFFVIAQYLQTVRGYSPLRGGIATLPFAVTMIAISPRGPALGARFGTKRVVLTGMVMMPVGLLLLSTATETSPYLLIAASLVIMSVGPALAIPTLSTGIVLSLPMDKAGVGSAVNDTTREVGGAIGIAVIGSILNAQYRSGIASTLAQLPPAAAPVASAAQHGVSALADVVNKAPDTPGLDGLVPQLQQLLGVAKHEFVGGMHVGLRVSAAVVFATGLVLAKWFPSAQPTAPGHSGPGH